jgi:hypothetical protein
MASFFNLTLDTIAPAVPTILLASGAAYTTTQILTAGISTTDGDTTGYQMKLWGDIDPVYDADVQVLEGSSNWIAYTISKSIKVSTGDGLKTVYLKIRDAVWNVSAQTSDTITLDTIVPVSTVSLGPDVTVVSKQTGKRTCSFSFQSDSIFDQYKVKVVPATGSLENAGTQIGITNGSTNMSGSAGNYPATTNIACTIDGADLEVASSGDGVKIVKVFVKDQAGNWSTV